MKLTFWGAAQQVTGSMYLLELEDDFRILIDCGMDLEKKPPQPTNQSQDKYLAQMFFPFEASFINVLLLTHAHIDHTGYLPNLIKEGFEGRIICTAPTKDLSRILLEDSANLNQMKLKKIATIKKNRRKTAKDLELLASAKELYSNQQVDSSLRLFETVPFNQKIRLSSNCYMYFNPAGHLLGAANIILEIKENGKIKKICFSGDVGRKNYPLLLDPQQVEQVDYLICESTYGSRKHKNKENAEDMLLEIIKTTCVDKPGKLIIPSFSVGRTQSLLYILHKLSVKQKFPPIKVFSDSPLALKSTRIYQKYLSFLNEEAKEFQEENNSLFDFENLVYVENLKQSQMLAHHQEPCVIISSSGMVQGGRIEYHVKENLQNELATILMVGFAAEGTLGYDLLHNDGYLYIRNTNKTTPVLARIESIDVFSGHGDVEDLLSFVSSQNAATLQKIFLVHGELQSMYDFKDLLAQNGYAQVEIPYKGQVFEL